MTCGNVAGDIIPVMRRYILHAFENHCSYINSVEEI